MSINMDDFKNQIRDEFEEYYEQNWEDYDGEWEDFKEEALESLWNSGTNEPIVKNYDTLLLLLSVIKENYEGLGIEFQDYTDQQKIFNLGTYFIANDFLQEATEEDYHQVILEAQA